MKKIANLPKLIKKVETIRQGYWKFQDGLVNSSYRTSIEDKFDVSLDLQHTEGSTEENDSNYKLSITPKYNFKHNVHTITFSGKDVKNLYNIIEERYNKYIEKLKKEDDCSFIESLNEFLEK
jgi:hypothetical protein